MHTERLIEHQLKVLHKVRNLENLEDVREQLKIYYISKITDNLCYLETASGRYKVTIKIEEISEFSKQNIIIGYNKLSGKLAVKTKENVIEYVNSKLKLSGLKPLKEEYYEIDTPTEIVYDKATNTATLKIEDKMTSCGIDVTCLFNSLCINWLNLMRCEELHNLEKSLGGLCKVHIDLDIEGKYAMYKGTVEIEDSNSYVMREYSKISSINIVNKDMFEECKELDSFFKVYEDLADYPYLDLSECELHYDCRAIMPFGTIGDLKLSDSFIEHMDFEHNLLYFCRVSKDTLMQMYRVGKPLGKNYKYSLFNCTITGDVDCNELAFLQEFFSHPKERHNDLHIERLVLNNISMDSKKLDWSIIDSIKITEKFKADFSESDLETYRKFLDLISYDMTKDKKTSPFPIRSMFCVSMRGIANNMRAPYCKKNFLELIPVQKFIVDLVMNEANKRLLKRNDIKVSEVKHTVKEFMPIFYKFFTLATKFTDLIISDDLDSDKMPVYTDLDEIHVKEWWFLLTWSIIKPTEKRKYELKELKELEKC